MLYTNRWNKTQIFQNKAANTLSFLSKKKSHTILNITMEQTCMLHIQCSETPATCEPTHSLGRIKPWEKQIWIWICHEEDWLSENESDDLYP